MPLTDNTIKALQLQEKQYKITDKDGLYLLINKAGKYFRYDYKFEGKRKTLSLGVYPETTLKEARAKLIDAKLKIKDGVDPNKKDIKKTVCTFGNIAEEWFNKQKTVWASSHTVKVLSRLNNHILPYLKDKDITTISTPEILQMLKSIEQKGVIETAHRVKQILGQIFRYAIVIGLIDRDPSADLKGSLTPYRSKHMATITDTNQIGQLLRAIDTYTGSFVVQSALKLLPLVFVRPGELRHAEWSEVDIEKCIWKIPSTKMKMNRDHIVPMSEQAIKILNDIKPLTGKGRYLFPSLKTTVKPISENTINCALRAIGYGKEEITGHGFRAMASTLLHENNFPSHLIEMQLAHVETNSVRAAYNHALYLQDRIKMMQWWANFLDDLKSDH